MSLSNLSDIRPGTSPVSKLDAAERQLKMAIRLFFEDADPIPVHTLAFAAHTILQDLHDTEGKPGGMLKGREFIPAEYRGAVNAAVNKAANFFKHADRDPGAVLDFYPVETQLLLIDCCAMRVDLTEQSLNEAVVFSVWFVAEYPAMVSASVITGEDPRAARALAELQRCAPSERRARCVNAVNQMASIGESS